jgi:hypothetical protein
VRDVRGLGPRDQQHEGGLREQFDGRGIRADTSAVGDDVGAVGQVRVAVEGPAERDPQPGHAVRLVGVAEAHHDLETAAQPLRVLRQDGGVEAAPGVHGQRDEAAVRVERSAVLGGHPVDEVAAVRIAFRVERAPRPDRRQRHRGRADPGRALVGRECDQCHGALPSCPRRW